MADIFDSGLSALKLITKVSEIKIDNGTFKLFYKATTVILLACSFISSSKQFFGTPISCEVVRQPGVSGSSLTPRVARKTDGLVERQGCQASTHGQTDIWTDRHMEIQTNRQMDRQNGHREDRRMDRLTDGQADRRVDEGTDGWTDGLMDTEGWRKR